MTKNGDIFPMDDEHDADRRAFLKAFTATTAALAAGCSGGSSVDYSATQPSSPPAGGGGGGGGGGAPVGGGPVGGGGTTNRAPLWQAVSAISFTHGVASSVSIASLVSDPDGDALTITKNSVALPAGVTYDGANKRFVYDGVGAIGSTAGHILTANDGKP